MTALRPKLTYGAHLFKALTRQHHLELLPLLEKHIPKNGVVIDVGAHAGQFTKLFCRLVPEGHVYAFEPGKYQLSILRKVVALHCLKNVTIIPEGLSDADSKAVLQTPIKKSGSVGFGLSSLGNFTADRKTNSETVTIGRLDDFVAKNNLSRVDFIKADIEGWELRMLIGAKNTLEKFRPALMMESCDKFLVRAGDTRAGMIEFLSSLGYDVFTHDDDGKLSPPSDAHSNILCVARKSA